jgi:hypothetical protein
MSITGDNLPTEIDDPFEEGGHFGHNGDFLDFYDIDDMGNAQPVGFLRQGKEEVFLGLSLGCFFIG